MKKKLVILSAMVLVVMLALFAFTACNNDTSDVGEELIVNGNFSAFKDKKFDGWTTSSSSTIFGAANESDSSDNQTLYIDNSSAGYNYLKQTVKVSTNKIYKVTVDFKINAEMSNKTGAYVTFLENVDYKFVSHSEKTKGFVTSTFYVRPKNTDYLTIALCVGSEDNNCKGKAYFDNVSMQRVEEAAEGFTVYNFKKAKTVNTNTNASGITFVVMLSVFGVAALALAYIFVRRTYAKKDAFADFGTTSVYDKKAKTTVKWYQNSWFIVAMILLGAFLTRLAFLLSMYGMGSSMTSVITLAKSTLASKNGLFNYYANNASSAYAPGTLYILTILGYASKNLDFASTSVLLRFINVIADMAVVAMIFFYGKKYVGNKLATIYAGLYALLPFALLSSSISATFESVLIALVIGSLILMIEKKYISTYFVMTLATVLDIRALAVAPIIVGYFVYMYIKDNDDKKKFTSNRAKIVFGLVATLALAYLLTLPVAINQVKEGDAFFGFKVMVNEMTNTLYFVKDAFNLYGMVAMNGKYSQKSVNVLNLIFLLVLEAYVISLYFKNRNKQELLLLASFTLAVIAVFTIKVTYTYLYLSLALALMYTMVSGDKRMFLVSGGIATLGFINYGQLMNQSGFVKLGQVTGNVMSFETTGPFYIVFSVVAVLLIGYYAYVTYSITNNSKIVDIKAMPQSFGTTLKNFFKNVSLKLKKDEE